MRIGVDPEAGASGPVARLSVGFAAHGERFDLQRRPGRKPQLDARDPVEAAAAGRFAAEIEGRRRRRCWSGPGSRARR